MTKYYFFPQRLAKRQPRLIGRLEASVVAGLMWVLEHMPLEWATSLGRVLFRTFGPVTDTAIRVERNLAVAFPERTNRQRRQLLRDIFGNLGVTLAEFAQLDRIWAERERRMEFVAAPEIEFLRQQNRPAVLVTAHVSAYTLVNFVASNYHFPITTLYHPEPNPFVHELILRLYRALPVQMQPRDNSMRTVLTELSHGRTVGLASDLRLDAGESLPFFGQKMPTNTIPARLALRFNCELVAVRAERLPGGRFRVTMLAPIRPEDKSATKAEQARNMTAQLNRQFESWINATPGEWMCFARRWPREVERAAELAASRRQ